MRGATRAPAPAAVPGPYCRSDASGQRSQLQSPRGLIADEDRAGPASVWHQPVQAGADSGHVDQEVDGQDDDDQGVGQEAENRGSGADRISDDRSAGTVEGGGDPLLQVQAFVESADGRGVVLGLLNVVRGLVDEFSRLLSKRRDRGGDELAQ